MRMNTRTLAIVLADYFHDWIDGEDFVENYTVYNNSTDILNTLWVQFDSGAQFTITVKEVYE